MKHSLFPFLLIPLFCGLVNAQENVASSILPRFSSSKVEITFKVPARGNYVIRLDPGDPHINPKSISGTGRQTGGPYMTIIWFFVQDGYSRDRIERLNLFVIAHKMEDVRNDPSLLTKPLNSGPSRIPSQEDMKEQVILIGDLSSEVGAGFFVGQKGRSLYFLTAYHVVKNTERRVEITFYDGQKSFGTVIQKTLDLDLALVRCDHPSKWAVSQSLQLEQGRIQVQQSVTTIGHPYNNEWDVNHQSSIKDVVLNRDERYFSITPTGIFPGCSGGPVLNQNGKILGMMIEFDNVKATILSSRILIQALQKWNVSQR